MLSANGVVLPNDPETQDGEVAATLFEVLETQKFLAGKSSVTLIPSGSPLLAQLLAVQGPGTGRE